MQRWSNNATTTLAAPAASGDTLISVADGAAFAALEAGDFEVVTIDNGAALEIVRVTARSGNTWTVLRAQEGTAADEWPAGTTIEARITAGSLSSLGGGGTLGQDLTRLDHDGNARGEFAMNLQPGRLSADRVASASGATAVGHNTKASGFYATAVGRDATGSGPYSLALGLGASALGSESVAIGGRAVGAASVSLMSESYADDAIQMAGFHVIPGDDWWDQYENRASGTRATLATPNVDLATASAWQPSTTYKHGDVAWPTTGGAVQYRVWAEFDESDYKHATPVSKATEPSWPGHGGDVDVDASGLGYWVGTNWSAGYQMRPIPKWLTFTPTEIAFLCQDHSALTGPITISVGTPAEPTRLINAAEVQITGANQVYRCALPNPSNGFAAGEVIQIRVDSFASAGKCVGRFLVSGYFVEAKSRT